MSGELGYVIAWIAGIIVPIFSAMDAAEFGGYSFLDICVCLAIFELTLNFILDVLLQAYHVEEESHKRRGDI